MLKEFTEIQKTERAIRGPQFDRERHGSLFDRGGADSYYSRPRDPHWFPEGSYQGQRVDQLNAYEIAEYLAGYDHNERFGDKKSWD